MSRGFPQKMERKPSLRRFETERNWQFRRITTALAANIHRARSPQVVECPATERTACILFTQPQINTRKVKDMAARKSTVGSLGAQLLPAENAVIRQIPGIWKIFRMEFPFINTSVSYLLLVKSRKPK